MVHGIPIAVAVVFNRPAEGDKQIAERLGLSMHTVNEYTKAIFRHFGVRSRPELLARWIRRAYPGAADWMA